MIIYSICKAKIYEFRKCAALYFKILNRNLGFYYTLYILFGIKLLGINKTNRDFDLYRMVFEQLRAENNGKKPYKLIEPKK